MCDIKNMFFKSKGYHRCRDDPCLMGLSGENK